MLGHCCVFVFSPVMGSSEPHGSAILDFVPEGLRVLWGPPSDSGIVTCQQGRSTQWQIFVYRRVNSSDTETHQELQEQQLRVKRQPQKQLPTHKQQAEWL